MGGVVVKMNNSLLGSDPAAEVYEHFYFDFEQIKWTKHNKKKKKYSIDNA